MKLRVLDLFSGIGGFGLGLERAGMETVAFCERNAFRRRVLARHWPGVPCHDDVTTREFVRGEADVITGGFPCQDLSIAGGGAGLSGARSGLYRELVRAIRVVRPLYAIMENVAALLSRGLGTVLGDLAEIGNDAEWHCIPAAYVGAPHLRDRVWIIAHPQHSDADNAGSYSPPLHIHRDAELRDEQKRFLGSLAGWGADAGIQRTIDGAPTELDVTRLEAIGDALVPDIPALIGRAIGHRLKAESEMESST
jgi:DNA (cytosine-5)-methyltransferase 1